jgi:hypothetical protein
MSRKIGDAYFRSRRKADIIGAAASWLLLGVKWPSFKGWQAVSY